MQLPTLATPRLLLEPLTLTHSQGMFALWSAPEVCAYSGRAFDVHGDEILLPAQQAGDSDRIIAFFQALQAEGVGCRWAMRLRQRADAGGADAGAFVGALGFNTLDFDGAGACAELAYHLHPHFWGSGLMLEACRAALDWLSMRDGVRMVEAYIEPDNLQSIRLADRLADRLGFRAFGVTKDGAQRYLLDARAR